MAGKKLTRRKVITAGVLTGAAGAVYSVAHAFGVEPNLLHVNAQTIHLQWLPQPMSGLKIAHLTDFHYDPENNDKLLDKVKRRLEEIKPDIIIFTGDYITKGEKEFDALIEKLNGVSAPHGVYASMGNHDGWESNADYISRGFTSIGVKLLVNANEIIQVNKIDLCIAGLDYQWLGEPDVEKMLEGVSQYMPVIALVHEPDYFEELAKRHPYVMQFSGHTHGGQCRVPIIGYAPIKVKYGEKYIKGTYAEGPNAKLYVSSGIGTVGVRVRFACPPEIAVLTLENA